MHHKRRGLRKIASTISMIAGIKDQRRRVRLGDHYFIAPHFCQLPTLTYGEGEIKVLKQKCLWSSSFLRRRDCLYVSLCWDIIICMSLTSFWLELYHNWRKNDWSKASFCYLALYVFRDVFKSILVFVTWLEYNEFSELYLPYLLPNLFNHC